MRKRVKIVTVISSLCLCLSLLIAGIFAAQTVSFSIISTLKFNANGAYVKVVGKLKQGSSIADATVLGDTNSTYTAYSYNRKSGSDVPDGSKALDNFINSDGQEDLAWEIGDITFTDELSVAVYQFTFTNYSSVPVLVTVSGITSGIDGSFTIYGEYTKGNVLSEYTEGSTAYSIEYNVYITLNNFVTEVSGKQLDFTVTFTTDLSSIQDETFYPELRFTPTTDDFLTVSVGKSNNDITGEIEIPSVVLIKNKPYSVTNIDASAFSGCGLLTSIKMSEGLITIGDKAFENCVNLANISIPNSVVSIGNFAFDGCDALKYTEDTYGKYLGNDDNPYFVLYDIINTSITKFIVNKNCNIICYQVFSDFNLLESVVMPEGLKSIGYRAFYNCISLKDVTIPNSVIRISGYAFYGCSSLKKVIISNSLTTLGDSVFRNCNSLINVFIPESVTSIFGATFYGCSSLQNISIPDSVVNIGDYTFFRCTSLQSITIPNSVTKIGKEAFKSCSSLKYIQMQGTELQSTYSLPSGTWVQTNSPEMPTDWSNRIYEIPAGTSGYFHQKEAWDKIYI